MRKGDYQRMGNTKKDNLPQIINGKFGVYKIGNPIGSGGNGCVCDAKVKDVSYFPQKEKYVIKFLSLERIKKDSEKKKRLKRFKYEIKTVQNLKGKTVNVIPIYDSFLNGDLDDDLYWYLMPKAKEYKVITKEDPLIKLERMIDLGETIKKLHELGKAHRDIKPSNIMIYNNRCYLTDFGLVWDFDDRFNITEDNDDIGPIDIRPPEMEGIDTKLNIIIDNRKVDVYLFAKSIWMYLKRNRKGFKGEYNLSDPYIFLDKKLLDLGDTISPLHEMMIKATRHVNDERIDINECLRLLKLQLSIATNNCDQHMINELKYSEAVEEVLNQIHPDVSQYEQMDNISIIISKLKLCVSIYVDDFGVGYDLGVLCDSKYVGDRILMLSIKSTAYKSIYVYISSISVSEEGIEIENEPIEDYKMLPCLPVVDIINCKYKEVGLAGKYKILARKI